MERLLVLALHLKKGFGFSKFRSLRERYGSLEEALRRRALNLDAELPLARKELEEAERRGFKVITAVDGDYPLSLLSAPQPPLALYLWGKLPEGGSVAVVGSRRCSDYGRRVAYRLGRFLSERGIIVISGLALGIDSAAHRGALAGGGRTVAVLGSSLDRIYPPSNAPLARRIVEAEGGIISEFPLGTGARREYFPRRNRIVSALSDAVVVVEAKERSGTFITVNYALDMGKEVFVVPGNIDSPFSRGTNRLLKEGATPLVDFEELLECLPLKTRELKRREPEEYGEVYSLLKERPLSADELACALGKGIGYVIGALSRLEVSGFVKREGVKWVAL